MRSFAIIAGCIAASFVFGCAPKYFGPPLAAPQTADTLAALLISRRGSDVEASARLTLRVRGRVGNVKMSHRLTGAGVFTADKARASFKKGPFSALEILSVGDEITVLLPANDKAYRGDVVKLLQGRGSFPAEFHLDPLTFMFPVVLGRISRFDTGSRHHVLETSLSDGFRMRYIIYAATGVVLTSDLVDPDGRVILRKTYENFAPVADVPVPTLVSFNAPRTGLKGYLRLGKINPAPTIREGAFSIRISPGVEIKELDGARTTEEEAAR